MYCQIEEERGQKLGWPMHTPMTTTHEKKGRDVRLLDEFAKSLKLLFQEVEGSQPVE